MYPLRLLLLSTCLLWYAASSQAQQMPSFYQYQWLPRLFNPAAQGADGQGQLTAAYRLQFQQLAADVRPNTYVLHADLSSLMPERIGVAVQAGTDRAHLLRQTQMSGFFAYQLLDTERWRLSLGLSASIRSYRFDLNAKQLGDAADLSLFQGIEHRLRFDGGPGMALEYRLPNRSVFFVDAAAAQLFTSAIDVSDDGNSSLLYRTAPHALVNFRYRHQARALAVEPALLVQLVPQAMKGAFTANVNAYFFPEDRLMVGAGWRSHGAGLRFVLGFSPVPVLRLTACSEWHRALGTTYEFGASIAIARRRPAFEPSAQPPSAEPVNLLRVEQEAVQALRQAFELSATFLEQRQQTLTALLVQVESAPEPSRQIATADSCRLLLAQSEVELQQMDQILQALQLKQQQARQVLRKMETEGLDPSEETRAALLRIDEQVAAATGRTETLKTAHRRLDERCSTVRPQRDEATYIRMGDGDGLQALLSQQLRQTPGLPRNLLPLRVFAFPGAVAVTYHFPDDDEDYRLGADKAALARHVLQQIHRLQAQGLVLENFTLVTELQEDRSTLTYEPGVEYDGFLGDMPLVYALVDSETAAVLTQAPALAVGASLNLETLSALKLAAWKKAFIQAGVPAERIFLQVRYNHSDNAYRQETKLVMKWRS